MKYWLILVPLLTAFTSWMIVRILVSFIFRPLKEKSIGGFRLRGLLPASQERVALMAGNFIAKEFSAADMIKDKIADPKNFEKLRPLIEAQIDDFLRNRLKVEMPMVGMFIGDRTIDQLKPIFINEIEKMFPLIMERYSADVVNELNVESMVAERIKIIPHEKIESLLKPEIRKRLGTAYAFAAIFGLLIGIIQLLIISLV